MGLISGRNFNETIIHHDFNKLVMLRKKCSFVNSLLKKNCIFNEIFSVAHIIHANLLQLHQFTLCFLQVEYFSCSIHTNNVTLS